MIQLAVALQQARTGIGPTGVTPFPLAAIHLQRDDGFVRGTALEATANEPPGFAHWDDMAGLLRLLPEG